MSYCVQCQWMLQEPATVNWTVCLQTTLLLPRLQLGGKVFERVYQVVGTYTKVSLRKMGHSPPSLVSTGAGMYRSQIWFLPLPGF